MTSPGVRPQRITLWGRAVYLEPLRVAAHAEALWNGTRGSENDSLWEFLFDGPFRDRESFDAHLQAKAVSDDPLFFAIVDHASGLAVGCCSLMRIEPAHRVIEVGNILYTSRLQRTRGATEVMYLLARYVFEDLNYRRYEWKCNALNAPSRSAALRLGFQFEGVFRQHMIVKGKSRDTAWFAMLDADWPDCKRAFEQWLDPANFATNGDQKQSLAALRASNVCY